MNSSSLAWKYVYARRIWVTHQRSTICLTRIESRLLNHFIFLYNHSVDFLNLPIQPLSIEDQTSGRSFDYSHKIKTPWLVQFLPWVSVHVAAVDLIPLSSSHSLSRLFRGVYYFLCLIISSGNHHCRHGVLRPLRSNRSASCAYIINISSSITLASRLKLPTFY